MQNQFKSLTFLTVNVVHPAIGFYQMMYGSSVTYFSFKVLFYFFTTDWWFSLCSIRYLLLARDQSLVLKCWMITGSLWLQEVKITLLNICAETNTKKACSDVKMTGTDRVILGFLFYWYLFAWHSTVSYDCVEKEIFK